MFVVVFTQLCGALVHCSLCAHGAPCQPVPTQPLPPSLSPQLLPSVNRCGLTTLVKVMTESKGEHSFVADAHNWEQRIKTENEASQVSYCFEWGMGGHG